MKGFKTILALGFLLAVAFWQTDYQLENEPWKYADFDEDAPFEFEKISVYAPKGCGLDEMQGLKDWIDNDSAKFPDLGMFSQSGEPYIRLYSKGEEIFDDIPIMRHNAKELTKLLIKLGANYKKDLTWELREQENKLKKAFYAPEMVEDL